MKHIIWLFPFWPGWKKCSRTTLSLTKYLSEKSRNAKPLLFITMHRCRKASLGSQPLLVPEIAYIQPRYGFRCFSFLRSFQNT